MLDGAQPVLEAGVLDLGLGQPPIELGQLRSDGVEALVSLVMAAEQAHGPSVVTAPGTAVDRVVGPSCCQ